MFSYNFDLRELKTLTSALHNRHTKPATCDGCGQLNKKLFTSNCCQLVRYCSAECQQEAKKTHLLVCNKYPMFTMECGLQRQIEDNNKGDRLPVIKVFSNKDHPELQKCACLICSLMSPISNKSSVSLLRPFYITSKNGAEFYDDDTEKRSIILLAAETDWEKRINDGSYPYCVTPVFQQRLEGTSSYRN